MNQKIINNRELANIHKRALSFLLDNLLLSASIAGLYFGMGQLKIGNVKMMILILFPISLIYNSFSYRKWGQTFGCAVLGTKVVNSDGENLNLKNSVLRGILVATLVSWPHLTIPPIIILLLSAYTYFFKDMSKNNKQAVWDYISHSYVISIR